MGDGWFLSALCAVSTRRDLLDVILPHHSVGAGSSGGGAERGIYTIRFYKYGQVEMAWEERATHALTGAIDGLSESLIAASLPESRAWLRS